MDSLPKQLQRLARSYMMTPSPAVFECIIDISRPVIFYALHLLKKYRSNLRVYEDSELYDTAIVGISNFLTAFDPDCTNEEIIPKLISSIMAEVNVVFRYRPQLHYVSGNIIDKTTCSDEQELRNERIEMRDQFSSLIRKGYITEDEFCLLVSHVVDGVTNIELAIKDGVSVRTISRRLKHIVYKIRSAWFIEGWE